VKVPFEIHDQEIQKSGLLKPLHGFKYLDAKNVAGEDGNLIYQLMRK
jgi:hypothetical protein